MLYGLFLTNIRKDLTQNFIQPLCTTIFMPGGETYKWAVSNNLIAQ